MKEAPTGGAKGHKNKPKKEKGIPRKAIKNLINNELTKQAQDVFQKLMKSEDLVEVDMTPEEAEAVHEGIECDGCGAAPIRGLRYKCTICKNFDYCAACEERQSHEHAFLKIRQPGGAPDVMIVIEDENNDP
jgi:tRNA(Ile)-lysidine synthase TilS/MesJ